MLRESSGRDVNFAAMTTPPNTSANSNPNDTPAQRYTAAIAGQIEAQWQAFWREHQTFCAPNPGEPGFDAHKPKKFILDMFPYPSGVGLHVGHPVGYIATDVYARYLRMSGHNVLHAMGYDAFGLPAEQYAVQTGQHPRITTEANIKTMKAQLARLGMAHDDRRGVATTDEAFYRWTQWIFLQIYNSWYDADAPRRDGGKGRARPIAELIGEFEKGTRPTSTGKAWSAMSPHERSEEIDARRLAFVAEIPVNWCPRLGTVLANEEVTADGRSERGNFPVFKRPLKQWMMRITSYADRLADDLSGLNWPEPVKLMQRHWIGRSEGALVRFEVEGPNATRGSETGIPPIEVFTTRPDTLFGATYMVLAPEHPLVDALVANAGTGPEIQANTQSPGFERAIYPFASQYSAVAGHVTSYRAWAAAKTPEQRQDDKQKTGVFTGSYAINPVNGTRVPIFIADYVMMGYGTGAIMAVPAHDSRDFAFAKAFGLPIVRVVKGADAGNVGTGAAGELDECSEEEGIAVNSPWIDGLATQEAKARMIDELERRGIGTRRVQYKLRDWLFSRQRYWGEPFPIVYDEAGNAHALPESMLPVLLPELDNFQPQSSDDPNAPVQTPLSRAADWVNVTLDLGDGPKRYTRETNTMPNWAGSCWYYLRYLDPENQSAFIAPEVEKYWMAGIAPGASNAARAPLGGVDLYVGGVEHAVLHLLYARFWHKVLFDLGHVSTGEPFQTLFNQGYVQAFAYKDERGVYVEASKVVTEGGAPAMENQDSNGPFFYEGKPVTREYGKMGKSLKNAVAPDEICADYGCDTMRLYEMSMGPLEASKPWNPRDIVGSQRFLARLWRNLLDESTGASRVKQEACDAATTRKLHKTIIGMRQDMERLSFNTAVARLIEFNNHLSEYANKPDGGVPMDAARAMILMLAPFAPHISEELWHRVVQHGSGARQSIALEEYPIGDPSLAADDSIEVPIQIQGKVRHRINVPANADAKAMETIAMADAKVQELLGGKTPKRVIVVPGKLVNIVI